MFATAQDERIYDEAEYVGSDDFYATMECDRLNRTHPFAPFIVQRVEQVYQDSVFYLWAVVERP